MSLAREPLDELDVKILQAAAALREHVEASASTDLAWADFEATRTGAVAFVRPSRDDRRGWMVMATVGMVAVLVATLVLVRVANEKPPTVRPAGPTITSESYEGTVARLNGDLVVVGVDGNEQVIGHIPASVLQSEQLVGGWPGGVNKYLRAELSSAGWVAVTGFVSEGFWFFDLRDPSVSPRWVALAGRTSGSTSAGTWNPDGTLYAAVEQDTTAVIIDPATGQLSRLPSVDPPIGYPPTWTADGSGILTGEAVRCDGRSPIRQRRLAIVPIDGGPESENIPDLADGLQDVSSGGMWATDNQCTADPRGTPDPFADPSALVVAKSPSGAETWVDAAKITPEVLRHSVFATTRPTMWVLTTEDGNPARVLLHEIASPQSDRVVNTFTYDSASPQQYVIVGVAPDDSTVLVLVNGQHRKFYLVPTDGSPAVELDGEFAGFVPRSMLDGLSATTPATTTPDTTTPATTSDTTGVASTLPAVNPTMQTIGPDLVGAVDFLPYPPNAIALSDGRVLKIQTSFGVPGRFQLFDPATGKVTDAGAPLVDRANPVMVELADGRVLVGGGDMTPRGFSCTMSGKCDTVGGGSTIADSFTGEVFDPATRTSVATGPMATTWPAHGALLPNGQVLIVGPTQRPSGAVAEPAELYDPVTNRFLVASRRSDTGTATDLVPLADGRLLVVASPPELYDPATGEFSPLAADAAFTIPAAHVALADGSLLLIDGYCSETNGDGGDAVATQRFDPAAGTLTAGPNIPHCVETATKFPNGEVLVTGFAMTETPPRTGSLGWAGVLDPTTGVVREVTPPTRRTPRAFAMPDGSVVLVAGVPIDHSDSMPWADVYRP